ncbi:hypothetical protein GTU79_19735 [Sodalis ligni]|uniref:hypothetical protein n=1 Tax=Sodalis ligni TaxID=2697027 RepID=UPI00193EFEBA|nr:hypothetical protein [Sodalis ligni]QWA09571.1 hypothetical protein GTU79_19735 [Sodalis ligni]
MCKQKLIGQCQGVIAFFEAHVALSTEQQFLLDVTRVALASLTAESYTYLGANVAERLESMADDQRPGSEAQRDLRAAATAWRKHIDSQGIRPVEWGAPKTVRQLIQQLQTLDPDLEPVALLRMPADFRDGHAYRQIPILISFEKVDGPWLAPYKGDGRKVLAFWSKPDPRDVGEQGELLTTPPTASRVPDRLLLNNMAYIAAYSIQEMDHWKRDRLLSWADAIIERAKHTCATAPAASRIPDDLSEGARQFIFDWLDGCADACRENDPDVGIFPNYEVADEIDAFRSQMEG